MKIPCHKNCPERAADCHISCGKYKAYRTYLDKKNVAIRQEDAFYGYKGRKKEEREKKLLRHAPKYTIGGE